MYKAGAKDTKEVKVVWDVTIGNEAMFKDRLGLIQQTADVIRKNGMTPRFVIVIHGPATKFAVNSLYGTKFENEKLKELDYIHRVILEMKSDCVRFIQCEVPMARNNVSRSNILPYFDISETVFYDLAILQMEGYAYIPIYEM
ncbi:MAG: hypothetical protein OHK0032_05370 [Thermodesulfovibrionales bacterium]